MITCNYSDTYEIEKSLSGYNYTYYKCYVFEHNNNKYKNKYSITSIAYDFLVSSLYIFSKSRISGLHTEIPYYIDYAG